MSDLITSILTDSNARSSAAVEQRLFIDPPEAQVEGAWES